MTDVMSVEGNMIILRTLFFKSYHKILKFFFQSLSSIRIPLNNIKP